VFQYVNSSRAVAPASRVSVGPVSFTPPNGSCTSPDRRGVHVGNARLQLLHPAECPSQVVRVDRRAEAVFDGIRNRDRVIEILRLQDAEDGPENLLQGKALTTVDGEDRRGDEEPLVVGASGEFLPACDEGVPLLP